MAEIKSTCDIEPVPDLFLNELEWNADQNDIYNAWRMVSGNIFGEEMNTH